MRGVLENKDVDSGKRDSDSLLTESRRWMVVSLTSRTQGVECTTFTTQPLLATVRIWWSINNDIIPIETVMSVSMNSTVFFVAKLCSMSEMYRCLSRNFCLHICPDGRSIRSVRNFGKLKPEYAASRPGVRYSFVLK